MKVTREQILGAARRHFARSGYRKASLAAIAADLGVVKGALYYHVPGGKKEMLDACIRQLEEVILERMRAAITENSDAASALRAMIDAKIRVMQELPKELELTESVGEEIKTLMTSEERQFHEEERELIESVLARGEEQGAFANGVPRGTRSMAIQALVRHVEMRDVFQAPENQEWRRVLDFLLKGLQQR